ncbi:putative adhesin [Sphingobacterium detergens]|uniref:Putative adhesin n=2 Tax=Sphingobacterium detergens TaxID=1145106 RepID=A0A420B8D0_SPHD1|nr:putative adhesin [Sphingobacterium detergens]
MGMALLFANALQAQITENAERAVPPKAPRPPKTMRMPYGDSGKRVWKEIKVPNVGEKLLLKFDNVSIEGYSGKDVVITAKVEQQEENDRAKGLRVVNGSGLSDNSGMGMNIQNIAGVTEISMVGMPLEDSVHVRVPFDLSISVRGGRGGFFNGGGIEIKDIKAEVEISSTMGDVKVINVTGPLNVKVAQGDVVAKFVQPVKGPISLIAAMGAVDVAFPVKFGANVDMKTSMGNIYAADEFQFEKPVEEPKNSYIMSNTVKGKMNGGGQDVILKTSMGDIYIRTQK